MGYWERGCSGSRFSTQGAAARAWGAGVEVHLRGGRLPVGGSERAGSGLQGRGQSRMLPMRQQQVCV